MCLSSERPYIWEPRELGHGLSKACDFGSIAEPEMFGPHAAAKPLQMPGPASLVMVVIGVPSLASIVACSSR